ncbi:3'-5' exonuclease [Aerococcus urinaehominis]|uniref:3'-5' exonuclease n=2 Tax=Aerococcus urinaehominis TaxID=128944 RepID=A0A120IB39_9LACT|nr:3'-5' exonuclease [Aerococcus urinaehominis]
MYLLIKLAEVRQDRNGNNYIAFTFQDRSGSIEGKYWNASDQDIAHFQSGLVAKVAGRRELYNGQPQVRINSIRLAEADEPQDPGEFIQAGPMTKSEMVEEVNQILAEINEPTIKKIVRHILNQHVEGFLSYPAAKKHHHAFYGGLAFHTISMLRLAQHIANQYPTVDKSLLYAGTLIHDIGKTIELSDPLTTEYTLKGNLIGHISLVDELITETCLALDIDQNQEVVILLKHMVLSHHGKQEWGSPVVPHLLEAEILHHIDNLDASIQMMLTALDQTKPGEFSPRVYGLDGRNFYRPNSYQEQID